MALPANGARMATMVYAVESWILALMSWAWLSFQEMWAFSLLSSHAFYGLMWLSTCNIIASGIAPESVGPRSAYFAAVLGFTLHCACCILDTLGMPSLGTEFKSPVTNSTTCTLAKSNQLYFFSDTQLFLAQAGATLAYLILQLVVSGAALLDSDLRTLWPGPAWGCGLGVLLCGRFISTFDGMAKGVGAQAKFLEIFTLPVVEYTFLFYSWMYLLGIMAALEGMLFPGLAWRKSVRYVTFTATFLFVGFAAYVLLSKGLLTPPLLALHILLVLVSSMGLAEAVLAKRPPGPAPAAPPVYYPQQQQASWYRQAVQPQAVLQPQWIQPGRQGAGRQLRELRHVIPSPVEMIGEKNKGV